MIGRLAFIKKLTTPITTPLLFHINFKLSQYGFKKFQKQIEDYEQKICKCETQSELFTAYKQYIEKYNFNSHIYAYTCRVHTRLIRRQDPSKLANSYHLFGDDYSVLAKVNVDEFSRIELIDFANYFCIISGRTVISTQHPVVKKLTNKLLTTLMDHESSSKSRDFIDKSRIARFAEINNSPLYQKILQQLLDIDHEFNSFNGLYLFNSILKGHSQTITTQLELKMLAKILRSWNQSQLIKKQQIHHLVDSAKPVLDFVHFSNFLPEYAATLKYFSTSFEQILNKFYRESTGEEIIRLTRVLISLNNMTMFRKLLKTSFNSIKQDGSSSLNPIFILRLIFYCKNFRICDQLDDNWQQKIVKLFEYYFILKQDMDSRGVYSGIALCLSDGIFNSENRIKIIKMIFKKVKDTQKSGQNNFPIRTWYFHNEMIRLSIENFMIEEGIEFFNHLMKIRDQSLGFKFFHLFKLIFQTFSTKIIRKNILLSQKPQKSNTKTSQNQTQQDLSSTIFKFYKTTSLMNWFKKHSFTELLIMTNLLQSLYFTSAHRTVLDLLFKLKMARLPKSYQQYLCASIFSYILPSKHQPAYLLSLSNVNQSRTNLAELYFLQIQKQKNMDLRCSRSQAQFFMLCISELSNQRRFTMYCNNVVCYFLMTFNRKKFMEDVDHIINQENLPVQNYEYLYMKILTLLIDKSDNYQLIRIFVDKMSKIKFSTPQIFTYFYHKTLQNGILTHTELVTILSNLQFKLTPAEIKSIVHTNQNYYKKLNVLYKKTKKLYLQKNFIDFLNLIEQKLENKDEDRNILVRDLLRVLRSWDQDQIVIKDESKKKIIMLLDRMIMENTVDMEWQVKTLKLISEFGWSMPKLLQKIWRNLNRESQWKNELRAEQFFKINLLINDPNLNKQRLQSLIKLTQLCPDQISNQYFSKMAKVDQSICSSQMKAYIKFMAFTNKK